MKSLQITVFAGVLSLGRAWAADDVGLPALPEQLHNQDQLIEILGLMNNQEIEQAEFALQHSTNAGIKSLAQKLVDDHTRSNLRIDELKRADVEPQSSEFSEQLALQSAQHLEALTNLDAVEFDCVFLASQVERHQLAIDLVSRQLDSTDSPAEPVQEFLEASFLALESHGQSLQALLNQSRCE